MRIHSAASRIKLLIQLRWLVLLLQAVGLYPAWKLGWIDQRWTSLYIAVILVMATVNALFAFWRRRLRADAPASEALVFLQFSVDSLELCALLSLMGGPWHPLVAMFYVYVAASCAFLRGYWREAYLAVALIVILLLHGLYRATGVVAASPLFANPVLLFSQLFVTSLIWSLARLVMQRMQQQEERVRALERERERMQKLEIISATAAGFAHKFATPLANLKIRLRRLEAALGDAFPDDCASMQASLAQAEAHLRSIIATSREGGRGRGLRFQTVNLRDFLARFAAEQAADGLEVRWEDQLPPGASCSFPISEVADALRDLIENAWEASAKPVVMKGRSSAESGMVEVLIEDQGAGFPAFVQERFGEPFLTTKADGTGLGLYNAKNLFWALGGRLSLGRHKTGAQVTVHLPVEDMP